MQSPPPPPPVPSPNSASGNAAAVTSPSSAPPPPPDTPRKRSGSQVQPPPLLAGLLQKKLPTSSNGPPPLPNPAASSSTSTSTPTPAAAAPAPAPKLPPRPSVSGSLIPPTSFQQRLAKFEEPQRSQSNASPDSSSGAFTVAQLLQQAGHHSATGTSSNAKSPQPSTVTSSASLNVSPPAQAAGGITPRPAPPPPTTAPPPSVAANSASTSASTSTAATANANTAASGAGSTSSSSSSSSSATSTASPSTSSTASAAAPSSSSSNPQWADPNYRPSFAERLHHKFDVVYEQSHAGMRLLKRARGFMQRFAALQDRHAQELQKIVALERGKVLAMPQPDRMASCYASYIGFFNNMDALARANATFAGELKDVTVEQLDRFFAIGTQMVKDNQAEQERVHQSMLKVNLSVVKERDAVTQLLRKLADKRMDSSDGGGAGGGVAALASPTSSSGVLSPRDRPGKTLMDSLFGGNAASNKAKHEKSFQKTKEQCVKACESYVSTLSSANVHLTKYQKEELPNMLTQLQSLEEMRLHSLHQALKDFAKLQQRYTENIAKISNVVSDLADGMDATQDILNFCNRVCEEHGPALAHLPFTYDIPISLTELKAMQFDEPPSSLFYSTLEGVMKQQKALAEGVAGSSMAAAAGTTASNYTLDIPLIVPTLLRSIYENGGMTSEGIFRISAASEDLTRVRRQLESGDFAIKESNPHIAACLLKSWLRDLLTPVFPFSVYDKCIAIGQIEPFNAHDPNHANQVKSLMSDLPPLNESIVALLFGFIKHLSNHTEYVAKTRMNLANLALVFSPGLVRSEKNDPMQMLQDTKFASNFVARAVECSPDCFSDKSRTSSQQILEEIFASNVQA